MDRLASDFTSFGIDTYSHVPSIYSNVLWITKTSRESRLSEKLLWT